MRTLIRPVYDRVLRPWLPRKFAVYQGVPHRTRRLFDLDDHRPDWKPPLVAAIREYVRAGDTMIAVGGGQCVAPVLAARAAGPAGYVIVYEVSSEWADISRETIKINRLADRMEVREAAVGPVVEARGTVTEYTQVEVSELPAADVLLVDAEGAERAIVQQDLSGFRTVIIETHQKYDAPPDVVAGPLEDWRLDRREFPYDRAGGTDEVIVATEAMKK